MRSLALGFLLIASTAQAQIHQIAPDALKHLMLDSRVIYRSVKCQAHARRRGEGAAQSLVPG